MLWADSATPGPGITEAGFDLPRKWSLLSAWRRAEDLATTTADFHPQRIFRNRRVLPPRSGPLSLPGARKNAPATCQNLLCA